jgi:hypothetical protein
MSASVGNCRPSLNVPQQPRPAEEARVALLCQALALDEPILHYELAPGVQALAVWEGDDLALVLATGKAALDARRVNAAAVAGWRVLLVTAAEWATGTALKKARRAL